MTPYRLNCLLISITIWMLMLIMPPYVAQADDTIDWHLSGYGIMSLAGTMGYDDPGVGIMGEGSARWKFLELYAMGDIAYQHKQGASSGHTWGYLLQGRGYVWDGLYLLAQWSRSGYESEFESGTVWRKAGSHWAGGVGYNYKGMADVWWTISNRETDTPNHVWNTSLNMRYQIWKYLWGMIRVGYSTWDQVYGTEVHRLSGVTSDIGIGVRW